LTPQLGRAGRHIGTSRASVTAIFTFEAAAFAKQVVDTPARSTSATATMNMMISAHQIPCPGKANPLGEDSYYISPKKDCFGVFDGTTWTFPRLDAPSLLFIGVP